MLSVLDKAAKERRTRSSIRIAPTMVHHDNHHYRPIPSCGLGGSDIGPTRSRSNRWMMSSDIYDNVVGGGDGATVTNGGAGGLRSLQLFDISPSTEPAFQFPRGMAASLGFPFTNAQWKELERQAMIYKYMMASVPLPPHLLIPTPRNLLSDPSSSHSPLGSGLNLKFTNRADLEPGRCKRTDGKKWRCSRDVAPDQKYCERHMHRGRPRSRKPVELHAKTNTDTNNKKKTRYSNPAISAESPVPSAISSDSTVNSNGVASRFGGTISRPNLQARILLDKPSDEVANFDTVLPFASTFMEPRNVEWMVKAEPGDQQWHQIQIGLSCDSSCNPEYQEHALNLNSYGNFSVGEDQQFSLFLNETQPPPPRDFIDAWSNGASDEHSASSRNTGFAVSAYGKLSHSALSLSMGDINSMDDEMGQIHMGLGLMESDQNRGCCNRSLPLSPASWAGVAPGGPLAEVLHLSLVNTTAADNRSSSLVAKNGDCGTSPPAIALSTPSGVRQKTGTSFSESSSTGSPTLASTVRVKSETGLLWLNEGKLQSSG